MHDLISCIFLGFIQGLTEFLPISSSAHLVLFQKLLGWKEPEILFDVLLHFGTIFAVIIILWREIIISFKKPIITLYIVLGTFVTAALVFPFKRIIESFFENAAATGLFLIITGIVLFIADLYLKRSSEQKKIENLGMPGAVLIGLAQGVAVLPGISRSGATISTGIFLGMERVQAVKFSFLLSIPAVLGAGIVKFKDAGFSFSALNLNYISGMFAAFLSGMAAVYFMTKLLKKVRFFWFSVYCWCIGALMLILYR